MQNNDSIMDEVTPLEFFLSQNYPNPFKDKTVIKYCVAYKSRVQITVYNSEGIVIEKLVDEEKNPGTYEVEFNTSVCHSRESGNPLNGHYYYKMSAGDFTSEKKWLCIIKLSGRFNMKSFLQTLFFFLLVTQICFAQWFHQNSGTSLSLGGSYFWDTHTGWIVGESGTILKTTNGGIDWVSQVSGTAQSFLAKVNFVDTSTGWVCGSPGTILKTTNGGINWVSQVSSTSNYLLDVYFADSNTGWVVGGDWVSYHTLIKKTTNGGINWVPQVDSAGPLLYDCFFIDSVIGWVVGDYSLIMKTTNGGSSWIKQYEGTWEPGFLCVFFTDYNNGWVVGWDGAMMRTSDGGTNWVIYSGNLWNETLDDIFFVDSNNGWIVGGGFYKMLKTTDGGDNWFLQDIPISPGLGSIYFTDINTGWATGAYGTILHTTNAGVTFVEEEKFEVIPTNLSLSQNYPNPFNPITSFTYSIPAQANVTIKVFDITGKEIETLVSEEKLSGTYELTWSAESMPSGVYFYQLKAGNFIETKKMLLLK